MKRLFIISCLVLAGFLQVQASDADLFSYDKTAVTTALADLSAIENYVAQHPAITIADLTKTGNMVVNGIDISASPFSMFGEPPLGIPSFLWGCIFWVPGLLVVYIATDQDKDESKKALWGCVAETVVYGVAYFVIWGAVFATASSGI